MIGEEDFVVVDNIVDLPELEESHIVMNLKARYKNEKIYTNVGNILVAINPYKIINIYGLDMVTKYHKHTIASLPPHLFVQGNAAYMHMKEEMEDQVVVISGESGSGKTESTKLLMHFLAKISNKNGQSHITEQILEANPILESFGNAKTVINDNSSRFGKYVLLYFSNGVMAGSKTNKYLLERSRIVKQLPGERNYHFFYEMFRGLSSKLKSELHLSKVEDFAYLNFGRDAILQSRDDLVNFQNVQRAFEHHKFTKEEINGIFAIVSVVLHLGNVTFKEAENEHGMEGVSLVTETHCRIVGELLKVPFEGLKRVLTSRVTEARNEKMVIPLSKDQAIDVRDSISKALYHLMFRWLVKKMNLNAKHDVNLKNLNSIAILDIFGFEDLVYNSFEQLCINYANESLQYYFNKHIFKIEQEEYSKEGVTWYTIDFLDNRPVVDLISKRPNGIFHLLDEESYFPNGSDWSFLEKCQVKHINNDLYVKPRMADPEFSIRHYTGLVTYNVIGFIDKNRESLKSDVLLFLLESEDNFVSGFFEEVLGLTSKTELHKTNSRNTISPKTRSGTVSTLFHESLQSLLEMMRCNPWFIRCIKPNNTKSAMLFQDNLVLNQLRATGMLETVKIRKLGYSVRKKFLVFYQKFRSLLPPSMNTPLKITENNLQILCRSILENLPETWQNSYEIGKTKIFMKEDLLIHLTQARDKVVAKAVLVFQKYIRGRLAREHLVRDVQAVLTLQTAVRGCLARKHYNKTRDDIISVQAYVRKFISHKEYKQMRVECRDRNHEKNEKQMRKFEDEMKKRRSKILEEIKASGLQPEEVIMEKISFKVNANSLEIPMALALQISHHSEIKDNGFEQVNNASPISFIVQLPFDINSFDFKKYAEVYCPGGLSCIPKGFYENPILPKSNEKDLKRTLELSKLLLRFLIIENDPAVNQMLSISFLISQCLNNESLKDEMFLQIASKTFIKHQKSFILERSWSLMTLSSGCCHPSQVLSNYLLNYASHYCPESLAPICQQNLLRGLNIPGEIDRCHPPCRLEWMAVHRRLPMALTASFYDGTKICNEVDSWMTAEEFAEELLQERNLDDSGWSLELIDENVCCFLSGVDFVLDGIKEVETEGAFLLTNSYLLAYRIGLNVLKNTSNLEKLLAWKSIEISDGVELKEFVPAPPRSAVNPNIFFKFSKRKDSIYAGKDFQPPQTFDKSFADIGLSELSPLNARFVKYLESDGHSQFQPVASPSDSILDLSQIQTKYLKRTFVDPIAENRSIEESMEHTKQVDNKSDVKESRTNLTNWVEDVFEPALNDDNGLNYMNANEIAKLLKGGGDKNNKASNPMFRPAFGTAPLMAPIRPQNIPRPQFIPASSHLASNPASIVKASPLNSPRLRTKNISKIDNKISKIVNFDSLTEDDIEDDREYFDIDQLQSSETKLRTRSSQSHLTYAKVRWSLRARKEIFTRNEAISNVLTNELIYLQIISDLDKRCIRISQEDENLLKTKMGCRDLDFVTKKNHNPKEKSTIVEVAKQWPNYFSRIYQVSGGIRMLSIQYLGVSHTGVRLLSRVNQGDREQFNVLESISYEEIIDICVPKPRSLQIHYKQDKYIVLYFKQATRAQNLIEAFCIELEQNSVFVKAVQNYPTNESVLLSFAKGDIIKLTNKNQELEQGWLFGAVHGKVGMFPSEYVVPMAIHQVPFTFKTFPVNTTLPDIYNTMREPNYASYDEAKHHYIMLEFATTFFRKNISMSSLLRKDLKNVHKVWAGQEFLEKIKWTKSPIKDSLTCISSDNMNKNAINIFKCIMVYMNDYPLTKGSSSHNSVTTIFSYCKDHQELRDETYCQIIKQLTSNRSPKNGSFQQGWKLLLMFTSFFDCCDNLRPYVIKYLEESARDQAMSEWKLAEKCLHNLKQTMKYGGRKEVLDKTEISSITLGRYTRQVICTIPGNLMTRIYAETSMVIKDAVEQICEGFDIAGDLESSEYIIYIIHGNERSLFPLDDSTYVMDIVSDFAQKERPCQFLFCRFTWVFPLPTQTTTSHLNLMFAQSKPDYLDGLLLKPPPKGQGHVKDTILKLSFFLMKNDNFVDFQNKKGVQRYIPKNVIGQFTSHELQSRFDQLLKKYQDIPPAMSQRYFLETLSQLPLFGATFFVLNYVSSININDRCLLGVNRNGLSFLSEKTMDPLWTLPLHEILNVQVREQKRKSVEIKHGDLLVQNMSQLFTENPHPLRLLIEKYIKVYGSFRNSSSNTTSSSSSEKTMATDCKFKDTITSSVENSTIIK